MHPWKCPFSSPDSALSRIPPTPPPPRPLQRSSLHWALRGNEYFIKDNKGINRRASHNSGHKNWRQNSHFPSTLRPRPPAPSSVLKSLPGASHLLPPTGCTSTLAHFYLSFLQMWINLSLLIHHIPQSSITLSSSWQKGSKIKDPPICYPDSSSLQSDYERIISHFSPVYLTLFKCSSCADSVGSASTMEGSDLQSLRNRSPPMKKLANKHTIRWTGRRRTQYAQMVQTGYWEFKKWERREVKQDTRYRAPKRKSGRPRCSASGREWLSKS